jgi:pimeloyl-ACP methyl ester carboxylesterase
MKVTANGIEIEVEDTGAAGSSSQQPVVLLIMGLGMQLIAWPPALVDGLVAAGYRVVRFDNRDIGLSRHFDHLGVPNVLLASLKLKLGLHPSPPYHLHDMALDAIGVLDALGIAKAHVLGVSMGGMIAQRVALAAPHRTASLISVMSSSGARGLPDADTKVLRALLSRPADHSAEAVLAHTLRLVKLIGSPGFPVNEQLQRERILAGLKRSYHPAGTLRQMVAIGADVGHRAKALSQIQCPTLVIHGHADPLVPYACGVDTARRIPGADMVGIEGMGHDLPPGVVDLLLQHMLAWQARLPRRGA